MSSHEPVARIERSEIRGRTLGLARPLLGFTLFDADDKTVAHRKAFQLCTADPGFRFAPSGLRAQA
jgi:hypothetical protein